VVLVRLLPSIVYYVGPQPRLYVCKIKKKHTIFTRKGLQTGLGDIKVYTTIYSTGDAP